MPLTVSSVTSSPLKSLAFETFKVKAVGDLAVVFPPTILSDVAAIPFPDPRKS
tara:strand:+ start:278 stop:436 length:159 start_codon:yes stop_codon:yes gene_type:complete